MIDKITVGEYLLRRLHEVGITDVIGVPGDFNIDLVGMIDEDSRLNWIGECNELNAGYAADGYARIHGISALVTTYGPGELSAVNAIAGAYSECVPIIKIVGAPALSKVEKELPLHHTLLNGSYNQFYHIYQKITAASASLDFVNPGEIIDNLIATCIRYKLPVYVQIPQDVLVYRIDPPQKILMIRPKEDGLAEGLTAIVDKIRLAKRPVFLIGELIGRYNLTDKVNDFLLTSGYPYVVSWGGKGVVSESLTNFAGMYAGVFSSEAVRKYVESSDCVISLGWLECEVNLAPIFKLSAPLAKIA